MFEPHAFGPVPIPRQETTLPHMTEVLGLRLAYRGFVTGLAAAYVWLALAAILTSDQDRKMYSWMVALIHHIA